MTSFVKKGMWLQENTFYMRQHLQTTAESTLLCRRESVHRICFFTQGTSRCIPGFGFGILVSEARSLGDAINPVQEFGDLQ